MLVVDQQALEPNKYPSKVLVPVQKNQLQPN